jgi:NAD(P)-dependent dehydrogenase (short-subunit alcohol dehydrogenase family)
MPSVSGVKMVSADLSGTVAVVTGATTGIGKQIAAGLVRLGAQVVIGARDPGRGEAARAELAALAPGRDAVAVVPVDVADQASVRGFCAYLLDRYEALDLLVNNAGVWFTDRRESADGLELTFATNVVGPYLLTSLLGPALVRRGHARVVNVVSSIAGDYDATDLQFSTRPFKGFAAYAQSKQALRMLTEYFAQRFAGTGVTVNSAAPGFVRSDFNRSATGPQVMMINLSARLFGSSPARGADTPLWVAAAPELRDTTGGYFVNRKAKDGGFHDAAMQADLARRCAELTATSLQL